MIKKHFALSAPNLFLVFLAVNTALSYLPLPMGMKWGLGLCGLLIPWAFSWAAISSASGRVSGSPKDEIFPSPPLWVWGILGLLALGLRLWKLDTLMVWPHYDEGVYGYYASLLNQHWSWRLFYGLSRAPALYIWVLSLAFRIGGTSLTVLWLVPALVSAATLPIAYLAARQFFSRSISAICVLLVAFGFWPLFLGRFSFMTGMILWTECLAFFLLGKTLRARSFSERRAWSLALGSLLGVGFFIHLHWSVIVLLLAGTLFYDLIRGGNLSRRTSIYWLVPLFLFFIPFLYLGWVQGIGSFLLHLAAFHRTSGPGQLSVVLSYLSALFWGADQNWHSYQPVWGGFLNPVLGALFFIGLLEIGKRSGNSLYRWMWAALGLFLLPGILTSDLEPFRLVPLIPLLAAVIALGSVKVVRSLSKGKALRVFALLMLLSVVLDGCHLFAFYPRLWDSLDNWRGYAKSLERYRAYGLLKEWSLHQGPGLIFGDFLQGLPDQTLRVAVYDFNGLNDPRSPLEKYKWAAVLTNVNEQPYLSQRFPDGHYAWLSKDAQVPDGGSMLFILPIDPSRILVLKDWQKADLALSSFTDKLIGYFPGRSDQDIREGLEQAETAFAGDPFLQTCYWEKMADLEMKGGSDARMDALHDLEKASTKGYPAAHLYERMGVLWLTLGNKPEAEKAFQKARQCPRNSTDAGSYLQSLGSSLK